MAAILIICWTSSSNYFSIPVVIPAEAIDWMNELDKQHNITNSEYGMGDFIQELKDKGFLDEGERTGGYEITPKMEQAIRKNALEEVFGKLKKSGKGNHKTRFTGIGDENTLEMCATINLEDSLDQIALTESIKNAQPDARRFGFYEHRRSGRN